LKAQTDVAKRDLASTPEAQLKLRISRENELPDALNCLMLEPILRSSIKKFTGESWD
jgi:hypothetical protein